MANPQNLFIVVRHKDKEQAFANRWIDDRKLEYIITTDILFSVCERHLKSRKNEWVYIYRTALSKKTPQRIVSRCRIDKVDSRGNLVSFKDHEDVDGHPPFQANSKTYYQFDEMIYEPEVKKRTA